MIEIYSKKFFYSGKMFFFSAALQVPVLGDRELDENESCISLLLRIINLALESFMS